MYCSRCGSRANPGDNFCTKCGFKLALGVPTRAERQAARQKSSAVRSKVGQDEENSRCRKRMLLTIIGGIVCYFLGSALADGLHHFLNTPKASIKASEAVVGTIGYAILLFGALFVLYGVKGLVRTSARPPTPTNDDVKKMKGSLWSFLWGGYDNTVFKCIGMGIAGLMIACIGYLLVVCSHGVYYVASKDAIFLKLFGEQGLSAGQWCLFGIGFATNIFGMLLVTRYVIVFLSMTRPPENVRSTLSVKMKALVLCVVLSVAFVVIKCYIVSNMKMGYWGVNFWEWVILIGIWGVIWRKIVGVSNYKGNECVLTIRLVRVPLIIFLLRVIINGISLQSELSAPDYEISKTGDLLLTARGDTSYLSFKKSVLNTMTTPFIMCFGGAEFERRLIDGNTSFSGRGVREERSGFGKTVRQVNDTRKKQVEWGMASDEGGQVKFPEVGRCEWVEKGERCQGQKNGDTLYCAYHCSYVLSVIASAGASEVGRSDGDVRQHTSYGGAKRNWEWSGATINEAKERDFASHETVDSKVMSPEEIKKKEIERTKATIASLDSDILRYHKSSKGALPESLRELRAMLGAVVYSIKDEWGKEIYYETDGVGYVLQSAGPDGEFMTSDDIIFVEKKIQQDLKEDMQRREEEVKAAIDAFSSQYSKEKM